MQSARRTTNARFPTIPSPVPFMCARSFRPKYDCAELLRENQVVFITNSIEALQESAYRSTSLSDRLE